MADIWGPLGAVGAGGSGLVDTLIRVLVYVIAAIVLTVVIIVIVRWKKNKNAFNIPVTIWIPRSDGKIVDEFMATGGYFKSKSVGGITSFRLKRKGVSTIDIPPPSSHFLVGLNRKLYLVQKGMDDFEPVLPESFKSVELVNQFDKEGKPIRRAVINLKCVNQDATAWKFDNEDNAKKRFTIFGLWDKYKDIIQMTVFVFIVFLAIYIMWFGLKDFTVQLARLVDVLVDYNSACPIVS